MGICAPVHNIDFCDSSQWSESFRIRLSHLYQDITTYKIYICCKNPKDNRAYLCNLAHNHISSQTHLGFRWWTYRYSRIARKIDDGQIRDKGRVDIDGDDGMIVTIPAITPKRNRQFVDVVPQFVEISISNNAALVDCLDYLCFRKSEIGSVDKAKLNALTISIL